MDLPLRKVHKIMGKYLIVCVLNLFSLLAVGSDKDLLRSPYHSLQTFFSNFDQDTSNMELARKPFIYSGISPEKASRSAIQLKQLLDGAGIFIYLDQVPKSGNYYDSAINEHRYVLDEAYPEIFLSRRDEMWIFTRKSISAIEKAHDEMFILGSEKLLELVPGFGLREVFGLYIYQYIGILIISLISVLIHKIFSYLFNRLFIRIVKRAGKGYLAEGFLIPIARPVSWFVVILLILFTIPVLQLPPTISHYVILSLKALLPFFGTLVFYRLVNVVSRYLEKMAERTESTLDDQLVPLFRKTLKTFVVMIGTLFVLNNLEIDIIPLLTGLSIGGLAFALAAQDTIKNFFGSLMIFIDKPFQIGHWITSGDIDGTVEEVGFRSSRIRTFRNSLMYVPNGKLADSTVDNHGLRKYRRFYTQIAVTYDTPPELIETFVEGLRKIVDNHPNTRKDYYNIYFNDMAAFSLNIMFYVFFDVPTWPEELKARHEVLIQVVKLADKLGINFAFPTQTLHMENFPGQPSLSPGYISKDEMRLKMQEYFEE